MYRKRGNRSPQSLRKDTKLNKKYKGKPIKTKYHSDFIVGSGNMK